MERRISKKVNDYIHNFKNDIAEKIKKMDNSDQSEIMNYIYQYNNFELTKEDFMKRKRVKNMVPVYERCCAKRANGQQCTRRKKDGEDFCGTHVKGTPYGIVEQNKNDVVQVKKCEIWVQEIKGIQYFIDSNNNIYLHEDILNNKKDPVVIGSYSVDDSGKYSICGELS